MSEQKKEEKKKKEYLNRLLEVALAVFALKVVESLLVVLLAFLLPLLAGEDRIL